MTETLEGIILSLRDYREKDVLVRLLCKTHGYQSIVARGVRSITSKNAAVLQPYAQVRCHVDFHERKTLHHLRSADNLDSYRSIRADLEKSTIAGVLCECMEKAELEDGYSLLVEALEHLANTQQPYALLALFYSCINRSLGIEPYVDGCVICAREQGICAISYAHGGFVCRHCYDGHLHQRYDAADLKRFRLLCKAQMCHYDVIVQDQNWTYEHFMLVYRFFAEYSGIRLQSMKFLSHLQEMKGRRK